MVLAETLGRLACGEAFAPAGPLLALLVWSIPLSVLSRHYPSVLLGFHRQRALLSCTTLSAVARVSATVPTIYAALH